MIASSMKAGIPAFYLIFSAFNDCLKTKPLIGKGIYEVKKKNDMLNL